MTGGNNAHSQTGSLSLFIDAAPCDLRKCLQYYEIYDPNVMGNVREPGGGGENCNTCNGSGDVSLNLRRGEGRREFSNAQYKLQVL